MAEKKKKKKDNFLITWAKKQFKKRTDQIDFAVKEAQE